MHHIYRFRAFCFFSVLLLLPALLLPGAPGEAPLQVRSTGPIKWAATAPTVDGTIGAGEWNGATQVAMTYGARTVYAYLMNDETHFYLMADAAPDTTNDGGSGGAQDSAHFFIDGENDGKVTYHNTDGTQGNAVKPVTQGGPVVDRWVTIYGNGTEKGAAGWVNFNDAAGTPQLWYSGNGEVNRGGGEPYDYAKAGFTGGRRVYEWSIPLTEELNMTMGDRFGLSGYVYDYNGGIGRVPGTLPSNLPAWSDPESGPYEEIRLNSRPFALIASPANGSVKPPNQAFAFDASTSFDKAHPGALTFAWDFGDTTTGTGAVVNHAYAAKGTYTVKVTVTDTEGLSNSTTLVVHADTAPAISAFNPSGDPVMDENTTLNFTIAAGDADGDRLTLRWLLNGVPKPASDNSTTFAFSPDYRSAGKYSVNVTAGDWLLSTGHQWLVTVLDRNAPPYITRATPNGTAVEMNEGEERTFFIEAADIDPGQALSYRWLLDGGNGSAGQTFSYRAGYGDAGNHTVTGITADTAGAAATREWRVAVRNVNRPPALTAAAPDGDTVSAAEGDEVLFTATASDPDGETLLYRWSVDGAPAGGPGTGFTYSPDFNASAGSPHTVEVNATDPAGAAVTRTWLVFVKDVNQAPVVTVAGPGNLSMKEGESAEVRAEAYDPDGDSVTFRWFLDGSPVQTGGSSYTYAAGFSSAGNRRVVVEVSDGTATVARLWLISVADVNHPPTASIRLPDRDRYYTFEAVPFSASAGDTDGDALNFTWDSSIGGRLGTGANLSRRLGEGTHTLTLTVDDGKGGTAQATRTVTVVASALPVLAVTRFEAKPAAPSPGEEVAFTVSVANMGTASVTNVKVTLLINGSPAGDRSLSIPAGGEKTAVLRWTAAPGTRAASIRIEPQPERFLVDESGHSTLSITVSGAAVRPTPGRGTDAAALPFTSSTILLLAVLVIAVAAGAGAYLIYRRKPKAAPVPPPQEVPSTPSPPLWTQPPIQQSAIRSQECPRCRRTVEGAACMHCEAGDAIGRISDEIAEMEVAGPPLADAKGMVRHARELLEKAGPDDALAAARAAKGEATAARARWDTASEALAKAGEFLDEGRGSAEEREEVETSIRLCETFLRDGDLQRAEKYGWKMMSRIEELEKKKASEEDRATDLGDAAARRGAEAKIGEAEELMKTQRSVVGRGTLDLARSFLAKGDYAKAQRYAEKAIERLRGADGRMKDEG